MYVLLQLRSGWKLEKMQLERHLLSPNVQPAIDLQVFQSCNGGEILTVFEFCFCFGGKKSTFSSIRFSPILPMYFSNLFFLFFACWWLKDQLRKFDFSSRIFFATMTSKSSMPPPAYKPKKKEPEIQGKVQKSQQKPPPMFVQKTLLRRTLTWKLEKHKQYFKNAAAWLLSIFFPLQNISSWHFSVNLFFILVPRQHLKRNILELCWNFMCENTAESSTNPGFATGVWRNVSQIDQTLAAELSKELSSSHGLHLQMTQFQSIYNMFST